MNLQLRGQQPILTSLRLRWALFAALCLFYLTCGFTFLRTWWEPDYAMRWLVLASGVITYLLIVLWRSLEANYCPNEQRLLPTLGWGNHLTLLRGMLVAALTGFLFLPPPTGWLAWAPGILYILSDATDFLDGYLARVTNHATRLGEILDMSFDGLGVLVAALLAVQYGQVPTWYLMVALARYLFLIGIWIRKRFGKPIYELPPSTSRRSFAGLQMGFLAVILLPIFTPPGTHIAAALFALPFLVGFTRDWLIASGVIRPAHHAGNDGRIANTHWLPVVLRLGIVIFSLGPLIQKYQEFSNLSIPLIFVTILETGIIVLLTLGVAGRFMAILGLCVLGISQMFTSLTTDQILLAIAFTAILFLGSGAFSLWAPEEYLVYHHAGEARALGAGQE